MSVSGIGFENLLILMPQLEVQYYYFESQHYLSLIRTSGPLVTTVTLQSLVTKFTPRTTGLLPGSIATL